MVSQEEKMYKLKFEVSKIFDSKCFICEKKFGRGFLYHHLVYKFGEPIYKDFKSTIQYNNFILPIIQKEPERFMLLCSPCHTTLERLKRRGKLNRIRLLLALWNTE